MRKKVNNWFNIIQYSLLPPTCILCGNQGCSHQDLCDACYSTLAPLGIHCLCCAKKITTTDLERPRCGDCQTTPPAFDRTYAPYIHQGEIRYLINQCKFNHAYKNSRLLGSLLAQHVQKFNLPELIIPIPLHPTRYRQRGYNQSLEIAKITAQTLSIPIDYSSCLRVKNTAHQISLSAHQRHKNIRHAFQVLTPPKAQHIAILDDVMTTGATANELAKTLKKKGVNQVDVWVCSRAINN